MCGPITREALTAPVALDLTPGLEDERGGPAGLGRGGTAVIAGSVKPGNGRVGLWGGGLKLGSGTHGLHTRTVSPPFKAELGLLVNLSTVCASPGALLQSVISSTPPVKDEKGDTIVGGCTINCRGIVIRCGEQFAQTTLPHFRQ